jgi:hypothetical protein
MDSYLPSTLSLPDYIEQAKNSYPAIFNFFIKFGPLFFAVGIFYVIVLIIKKYDVFARINTTICQNDGEDKGKRTFLGKFVDYVNFCALFIFSLFIKYTVRFTDNYISPKFTKVITESVAFAKSCVGLEEASKLKSSYARVAVVSSSLVYMVMFFAALFAILIIFDMVFLFASGTKQADYLFVTSLGNISGIVILIFSKIYFCLVEVKTAIEHKFIKPESK